jgi:hypothetical protein
MKTDSKITDILKENLLHNHTYLLYQFSKYTKKLEEAKRIKDCMKAKSTLLLSILRQLPLNSQHCYYCIKYSNDYYTDCHDYCADCHYGKIHGICAMPDSTFTSILQTKKTFYNIIATEYYNYDMEKESDEKVNIDVIKKLLQDTDSVKDRYNKTFKYYKQALGKAKTVKDIMTAKKEYLKQNIYAMPFGVTSCYYCIKNKLNSPYDTSCPTCSYGKAHYKCADLTSDFNKINKARGWFISALGNY